MASRRPLSVTSEHDELILFIRTMAAFWDLRLPGPISMAASLENALSTAKRVGRRVPVSGLRDAAHDMVVRSRQVSASVIREADAYCTEHGAVTLSSMIERAADAVAGIVARERIATDEECNGQTIWGCRSTNRGAAALRLRAAVAKGEGVKADNR